jgi:hypothetical protein
LGTSFNEDRVLLTADRRMNPRTRSLPQSPLGGIGIADLTIPRLFWLALALAAVAAVHASSEARDLNADGSLYLLSAVSRGGFAFIEWARRSVQFLQQSFAYLGQVAGVTDLVTLGRLLTLGMQIWPLILTAACWFLLPPAEKGWILGPLLNIAVVIPTTSFMGIGEGIIASCLMWPLFFLAEFEPQRWPRLLAAAALTGVCFYSHEACWPFLVGIAYLAARQGLKASGARRAGLTLVAVLAVGAAANLVYLIFHRPGADGLAALKRTAHFMEGLLAGYLGAIDPRAKGIHLPTLAVIAVLICLVLVHFPARWDAERRARALRLASRASLAFFALIALLFVAIPGWIIVCPSFMAARGWPIVDTTLMAAAIHLLRRDCWTPDRLAPPPIKAVLLGIIPMQFVIQTVLTTQWASYRSDLSALVASRDGPIDWQSAAAVLDPRHDMFRGAFVWAWSIEPLSIVLAPGGHVQSLVRPRPTVEYEPYRPDDPATLPRCVPGLDWSRYLAALPIPGASSKPNCAR